MTISVSGGARAAVSVDENSAMVMTVLGVDPLASSGLTYSIAGGSDASHFALDSSTGALNFLSAPDFEAAGDNGGDNVYDVIVNVSGPSGSALQSIAVTVDDANEAPAITSAGGGITTAVNVAENSTSVLTVEASDQDAGSALSYSIAGGADAGKFAIDSSSGALSFINAPVFENPGDSNANNVYNVTVKVSDGSLFDTQKIAVAVTDAGQGSTTALAAAAAATITVSNAAELMSALKDATGGETIVLKEGNYGDLRIASSQGFPTYASAVTITSEDPAHPAVFTNVNAIGVGNLSFENLVFDYDAPVGAVLNETPFKFVGCTNISLSNVDFDGDLASGVSAIDNGFGTGKGLVVTQSSNVLVENCTFTNWFISAAFGSVTGLKVLKNEVSGNSSDGFDFANVDNVLISGNHIHDFLLSPLSGAHPDMIQFWTTGTTSPSTNIKIVNNFLDMGAGVSTQSIFMRNEVVDQGQAGQEMFYRNVYIANNVIANQHAHGITVGETDGLVIDNNTVIQKISPFGSEGVSVPSINVAADSLNVTVTDNLAPAFNGNVTNPALGWTVSNNHIVQSEEFNAPNYVGNLFSDVLDKTDSSLINYQILAGSIIDGLGAGANLQPKITAATLAGYVLSDQSNHGSSMMQSFDATNLYSLTGKVDLTGATVTWNFGDGTTGTGFDVQHIYASPGLYEAKATITLASGKIVKIDKTVEVMSDHLLNLTFDGTAKDLSPIVNTVTLGAATYSSHLNGSAIHLPAAGVRYETGPDFLGNSEFSVIADFKKDSSAISQGGRLIYFSGMLYVTIGATGVEVTIATTDGPVTLNANKIGLDDANWHKLAVTFSGETGIASVYIDGEIVSTVSGLQGAVQPGSSAAGFFVGGPSGDSFVGLVDNVHYLADALTDRQASSADPLQTWTNDAKMWVAASDISYATIKGTLAADILNGTTSDDVINGRDGNDVLTGGAGSDILIGDAGNDILSGGAGPDMMNGGDGFDLLDYSTSASAVAVNLALGSAAGGEAAGDIFTAMEAVTGGAGNDSLTGDGKANRLEGGKGNDVIEGGAGADILIGGIGIDTLDYGSSAAGVIVSLKGNIASGGDAEGDDISGFENLAGSNSDDTLSGSAIANVINGRAGSDRINGGGGADTLIGGAGIDTLSYAGSLSGVTVDIGANTASGGDAAGDTISGFESLIGSNSNDVLTGGTGNNVLSGSAGNDTLKGGKGGDSLVGGAGADTFIFSALLDSVAGAARDVIADFSQAEGDVIDLSQITTGGAGGAFHFTSAAGSGAFSHVAGELRFYKSANMTVIQLDSNGDGVVDSEIGLAGLYTLTANDFIL